ncbi:HxlR family transcriptional regulator [Mycobacterium saskatchewanense]|uniref:winged helix-turn-helix transcriptional regulator n=1 Tax=Mycobacterium saskatchewanense TaxID=220927 RepID=UPI000A14E77B|nr:helix-turn-helix domain-containing protein [Mycobacterium saskatchewanense]BBX64270.1 HxlR family transcriptional regulator [Mycobacterium saskatchewanense]
MAAAVLGDEVVCSVERAVHVLGARWTPLILRELYYGCTRFDEIRQRLGIATNLLTTRLGDLVESGVIERLPYKDGHARTRHEYHLTAAGRETLLILGALQQWGDRHQPRTKGPSVLRRHRDGGGQLHVAFVDDDGREVALQDVEMVPAT